MKTKGKENREMASMSDTAVQGGFTLVEIVVGMAIAVILIASIYYIYVTSITVLRAQEDVISIQERLRFALEHIKRDVRKAGFLATPDSDADDNVCPKPLQRLMAISFARGGAKHLPDVNINITPSSVTLFGAYASPNIYYTTSIIGNVVTIQKGAGYPQTLAEFNQIFNNRHLLRIVNKDQYEMYFGISAADFNTGTITLDSAVPLVEEPNYCGIQGFGEGLEVNVANYIRYSLILDERDGAPPGKINLVREELQSDGVTPYEGSRLIIAEYIVDMQFYDFVIDNDPSRMDPNVQMFPFIENVVNPDGSGLLGRSAESRPQDLRFVTVKLSARSMEEDPAIFFTQRSGPYAPIDVYDIDPTLVGAAKVFSLAARVDIRSLMVRNVK